MNDANFYCSILLPIAGLILLLAFKVLVINGKACKLHPDLTGQVVIVTGSNCGIGKCTAFRLAELNATVILACRNEEKANQAIAEYHALKKSISNISINQVANNSNIANSQSPQFKQQQLSFMKLDLADLDSVKEFALQFSQSYNKLNMLINNAGLGFLQQKNFTKQNLEECFGTNHFGSTYLTALLLPLLKATPQSRVIFVASEMHMFAKLDLLYLEHSQGDSMRIYDKFAIYANSKLANLLTAVYLNNVLSQFQSANITKCVSLHPGFVRSDFSRYLIKNCFIKFLAILMYPLYWYVSKSCQQGAQNTLFCSLMPFDELKGGSYYPANGKAGSGWPFKQDTSINHANTLLDVTASILSQKNYDIGKLISSL